MPASPEIEREYRGESIEVVLRPHGWGRYFAAGFLLVWLTGWAAFEFFGVGLLLYLLRSLLAPNAFAELLPPSRVDEPGGYVLLLGFLTVGAGFMVLWTVGGVAALAELTRLFWSEDRVAFGPKGIEVTSRLARIGHRPAKSQ